MRRPTTFALLWILGQLAWPSRAQADKVAQPGESFAIVIGNNTPEDRETAALSYADDDAIAMHALLTQAGVKSFLFIHPDETTRRLHPGVRPTGAPRWTDVAAKLESVHAMIRQRAAAGAPTDLILYYSGHGNVANGEGYITLEDRRLTRTALYEDILKRSPALHNHVIVDSCKSYFLAFDKGAGGARAAYARPFANRAIPADLSNTGFLLSTSSGRDSHEWELFQSGVFSHEVRSGLRGAADLDGDGTITYAELGAFLATANEGIPSPRFRPDFIVRPPGRAPGDLSSGLLHWGASAVAVVLDTPGLGHLYVEAADGTRVLDVHLEAGQVRARLYLPPERPMFVRQSDDRRELVLADARPVHLSALSAEATGVKRKGASHLAFMHLFQVPFGPAKVDQFRRRAAEAPDPIVSRFQPEPPPVMDEEPPSLRDRVHGVAGYVALGAGALGVTMSLVSWQRSESGQGASQVRRVELRDTISSLDKASLAGYAIAGAAGATWLGTLLWPRAGVRHLEVSLWPVLAAQAAGLGMQVRSRW